MAITEEQYLTEYTKAYETVVGHSMEFLTEGQHTHLEKLFKLIDDQSADTNLTERLSMKKNAYVSLMDKITVASQHTAMEIVDRKYKLEHEIVGMKADASVKEAKMVNEKLIAGYHVDANGVWTGPVEADSSGHYQLLKMASQQGVLEDQALMTGYDKDRKQEVIQLELDTKIKQIASMDADIAFNISKEEIMVKTRKDNLRIKASESFAEFMKYMSAADIIPATEDFANLRSLVDAIGGGIANDNITADIIPTSGDDYQTKTL